MAGADKFGNIYFVRLPQDVSDEIEEDPTGGRIKWEQGKLNGAPNKVEEIVQFHVGDVVTCLQKASLIPGGGECIVFGTVMGSIGALHAFTSRDDVDFFSHLEMHMRQDHPPLCGRDHMAYRSAYFPVKVYLINIIVFAFSIKLLESIIHNLCWIKASSVLYFHWCSNLTYSVCLLCIFSHSIKFDKFLRLLRYCVGCY